MAISVVLVKGKIKRKWQNSVHYTAWKESVFSRIRNEYGEIRNIYPYFVRMRENADQKNSEYWLLLRSANICYFNQRQKWMKSVETYYPVKLGYSIAPMATWYRLSATHIYKLKIWFVCSIFFLSVWSRCHLIFRLPVLFKIE